MAEEFEDSDSEQTTATQKQNCIFCRIIEGQIPSKKIYEDDICMVILDINPAYAGHALILPKEHYQIMPQVPEKNIGHLFKVSKHISNAMLKYLGIKGTTIFVANGAAAGQKVPHFMVHVIPRKEKDDLFAIPKRKVSEKDLEKIQEIIIKKLSEKIGRVCVITGRKNKENIVDAEVIEEQKEEKEIIEPKSKETKAERKPRAREKKEKKEDINIDKIADMFLNK